MENFLKARENRDTCEFREILFAEAISDSSGAEEES
jgi:hypothetical protein